MKDALFAFGAFFSVGFVGIVPDPGPFNALHCDVQVAVADYILASKPEAQSTVPDALTDMHSQKLLTHSQYMAASQVVALWRQAQSTKSFRATMRDLCPYHQLNQSF